jgi:hypothetical protein
MRDHESDGDKRGVTVHIPGRAVGRISVKNDAYNCRDEKREKREYAGHVRRVHLEIENSVYEEESVNGDERERRASDVRMNFPQYRQKMFQKEKTFVRERFFTHHRQICAKNVISGGGDDKKPAYFRREFRVVSQRTRFHSRGKPRFEVYCDEYGREYDRGDRYNVSFVFHYSSFASEESRLIESFDLNNM